MTTLQAHNSYSADTKDLQTSPAVTKGKPYWDMRYVNPISIFINGGTYANFANHGEYTGLDTRSGTQNIAVGSEFAKGNASGSVIQSECVDGVLTQGTTINLKDAPAQVINYGGPQATFAYKFTNNALTAPWKADGTGNIVLQASFAKPSYTNFATNDGGGVNFGFFINRKGTNQNINFVVAIYPVGAKFANGNFKEIDELLFDTTTRTVHVSTTIQDSTKYTTKSQYSKASEAITSTPEKKRDVIDQWPDLFRVNISYQNLLNVLKTKQSQPAKPGEPVVDMGLAPHEWQFSSIMIQYELEENGGTALLTGSFKAFEVFSTPQPL